MASPTSSLNIMMVSMESWSTSVSPVEGCTVNSRLIRSGQVSPRQFMHMTSAYRANATGV